MVFMINSERVASEFAELYRRKAATILEIAPSAVQLELSVLDSGKVQVQASAQVQDVAEDDIRAVLAGVYAECAPLFFERLRAIHGDG